MRSRNELFLTAVDVIHSGHSLDLEGEHGSGRTHFLARIGDHFTALGWRTITVTGLPAFSRHPLVALTVAGVIETQDLRPTAIAPAITAIVQSVVPAKTLIIVDDWDALDEASAGVLRAAQARASVPILSSRLVHRSRHDPFLEAGAFTTTYALRLPGMGYLELEAALEKSSGFRLEAGSLSRVFAKSGGNIGLALAVVDAARREDRLIVEGGVGRAIGSLWTPALRHLTDVILRPLERDGVEALETLSILGPVGMPTAIEAVGVEMLSELEDRAFLSIDDLGGAIVSVRPPLLVERFRHDVLAGRRAELRAHLDGLLAAGDGSEGDELVTARDPAVFVRLVHEETRRRTLRARDAWRATPSLTTATNLLSALEADGAHDVDELVSLIGEARSLGGSELERARWDAARLAVRAVQLGEPAEAVDELRARASDLPTEGGLLLGRAAELETSFLAIPETDPLTGVDVRGMSPAAAGAVLRGRAFWHLARGQVAAADRTLGALAETDADRDALAEAFGIFADLLSDRMALAVRRIDRALLRAQRERDAPVIRIHSFLSALAALLDRRLDDAEQTLHASTFLGLPSPYPPLSFVGLKTIAAIVAARRGHRALMEQLLADVDAAGLSDGPMLGQSSGLAAARLAEVEDGAEAAADICIEAGDALWTRGALLSAANSYLEGLQYAPTPERWERLRERIAAVDSPMLAREARFVSALIEKDAAAVVASLESLEHEGRLREALHWAGIAARELPESERDTAERIRERLLGSGVETMGSVEIVLSEREREVAELVASGLQNKQIADALVVSVRSVESQVSRLLRRLGLTRRQDIKTYFRDSER